MPINLDLVGLNTLISETLTTSTNTIGTLDTQHRVRQALFNGDGTSVTSESLENTNVSNYTGSDPLSLSFWINLSNAPESKEA